MSKLQKEGAPIGPTLDQLRAAVAHTSRQIKQLEEMQLSQIIRTGDRLVADSPNGDLYVAILRPVDGNHNTVSFCYAPLAPGTALLEFNGTDAKRYVDAFTRNFNAQPVGTALTNVRSISKREFEAALIPVLKTILNYTKAMLEKYEPANS